MIQLLMNATGLRKLPVVFLTAIIWLAVVVMSMTGFGFLKVYYINKGVDIGRKQIMEQLYNAQATQKKKDNEEINNAKQIDKTIGAMSNDAIRDSLRDDFRTDTENRQNSRVPAVAKDTAEPQGHGRNAQTGTSKQPETDGVLPVAKDCYTTKVLNADGTWGEVIEVCDD